MNVYAETNFVLELILEQEQHESCEQVMQVCNTNEASLFIPAYSLAEPHETLTRLEKNREELYRKLKQELNQLFRTSSYKNRVLTFSDAYGFLMESIKEDMMRFAIIRDNLLNTSNIIPLTETILRESSHFESLYNLSPQDAFVYSSVIDHLKQNQPRISCFLNRNSKDFNNPAITEELKQYNCTMIPQFDDGLKFIQSRV